MSLSSCARCRPVDRSAEPRWRGNDGIRQQIGVNTVQAAPYNLDGTGVDVLVYDGGQVGAHTTLALD